LAKTFRNFLLAVSEAVDAERCNKGVIQCENFSHVITAAQYT
jgi:hypothetical protein